MCLRLKSCLTAIQRMLQQGPLLRVCPQAMRQLKGFSSIKHELAREAVYLLHVGQACWVEVLPIQGGRVKQRAWCPSEGH